MAYLVVGTAGHIDHGKSSLVKVLSGIDPDRLQEEKKRGITIELGFAYLQLPGGHTAAIVDVPGHERFIKNMLAGVAGIDLALLVIAADEGIMPQTREHFSILQLLAVPKLLVVITKADLVEPEMIGLLREEIRVFLAGTGYEGAPIRTFSAVSGAGKEEILIVFQQTAEELVGEGKREGFVRLPIDRSFTLPGFGTVVTGTLFSGEIKVGDQLFIPLQKKRVRVRSLQVHNKSVEKARAGQRVAVNLAGVEPREIERGDLLTEEGRLTPTLRLDAECTLLKTAVDSLANFSRVRFHQGTAETIGRIIYWDREELEPGAKAFVQLVLEKPVVVQKGDRYVLRSYSPLATIGGGRIIEPLARKHKKKESGKTLRELGLKAQGQPEEIILLVLEQQQKPLTAEELARQTGYTREMLEKWLAGLEAGQESSGGSKKETPTDEVVTLLINEREKTYLLASLTTQWEKALIRETEKYLQENPLEPGIKKELLRSRVFRGLDLGEFNALIKYWAGQQRIAIVEGQYIMPAGIGGIKEPWLAKIRAVEKYYQDCGWQVPVWKTVTRELRLDEKTGAQLLRYLTGTGLLLQLTSELYLPKKLWNEGQTKIAEWFEQNAEITVAQFRDLVGTSRKTAVPFLEYLDQCKITLRTGDKRSLRK